MDALVYYLPPYSPDFNTQPRDCSFTPEPFLIKFSDSVLPSSEIDRSSEGLGLGGASVDAPASGTPRSTSLQRAISQNARLDYTCYSLKSQDGGAVALLIEAKLLSSSSFATVQPQVSSFVCNLLPCACHDITLVFP